MHHVFYREQKVACVRNVEKAINKQDILFVLSNPEECLDVCDPCQEVLEPDEGDERLNLDLGRYRSSTTKAQRVTAATTTSKPIGSNACCQLKVRLRGNGLNRRLVVFSAPEILSICSK